MFGFYIIVLIEFLLTGIITIIFHLKENNLKCIYVVSIARKRSKYDNSSKSIQRSSSQCYKVQPLKSLFALLIFNYSLGASFVILYI